MTGLEPATSGVTGRRSNQLSYTRFFSDQRFRFVVGASYNRVFVACNSTPTKKFRSLRTQRQTARNDRSRRMKNSNVVLPQMTG